MTSRNKGLLYLALLSIFWGASFLWIAIAVTSISPLVLSTSRMIFASMIIYPFFRMGGHKLPHLGKEWIPFLVLGICNALLPYTLIPLAETHISPALTAVLFSTMPIFTVLLTRYWAREALTKAKIIGVMVGFLGVLIALIPTFSGGMEANLIGASVVLLSALLIAFSTLYTHKYLKDVPPIKTVLGMMLSAAAVGLPLLLFFEYPLNATPTTQSLLALVYLTVISTVLAFLMYFWLITNRGPTFASLVRFIQPPLAVIMAALFFGSSIPWTTYVGMFVILLSIVLEGDYLNAWIALKNTEEGD